MTGGSTAVSSDDSINNNNGTGDINESTIDKDKDTMAQQQQQQQRQSSGLSIQQCIAMLSNFSTSYNVVNISLVLPILKDLHESTPQEYAACASSLLAGMMVGQVVGGMLGDTCLGRLGALRLVMFLQILASIGSACIFQNPTDTDADDNNNNNNNRLYTTLAIWRFVLGIGAGGVYPLAATLSAETTTAAATVATPEQKQRNVVLTFSMQGVGFVAVPLVTIPLLYGLPASSLDVVWRIILGLGALPGIVLVFLQWRLYRSQQQQGEEPTYDALGTESEEEEEEEEDDDDDDLEGDNRGSNSRQDKADDDDAIEAVVSTDDAEAFEDEPTVTTDGGNENNINDNADSNIWSAIRHEPNLLMKLLGTAGTWFLFDVLFYGNTLFQPIVIEAAFGTNSASEYKTLEKEAIDSLLLTTIALPGYAVAALAIGKSCLCGITQTPRFVQQQGFLVMAVLYAAIGFGWDQLRKIPPLLVILYGLTFFFANYGPNTTTFVLPSLVFSERCRSTLNGISAASGKAGALVGSMLFEPAKDRFGPARVMQICALVSLVALAMTHGFVRIPTGNR